MGELTQNIMENQTKTEYYRKYRKQNSDKLRRYHKEYGIKNKDRIKQHLLSKRKEINEYMREYKRKNKIKGKNYTKIWLERISKRDGRLCKSCGLESNLTLQHKVPKCIGGKTNYENLEILCLKCNMNDYNSLVKKALKFYFENLSK